MPARNRIFAASAGCACAVLAASLVLTCQAANAQVAPIHYWIAGAPFGFGGGAVGGDGAETYGDVPGFDAAEGRKTGFSFSSYSAEFSSFGSGLGWSGATGYGGLGSFAQEGVQLGYNYKGVGGLPMTFFAGVDTLKYKPDVFNALTSLSPAADSTAATAIHAGVEIKPTSNLSLSFSAGFAQQQPGAVDSDIRSNLLPGETPILTGGRR